ncbi:MAG: thiamine diphosphokinase [Acidimicrobiia bacterium]
MDTILIFAGGDLPPSGLADDLPAADLIVAADSGYDIALHLGYRVDVLVGDMDSISSTQIPDHVIVESHPVDKDQTDLDLAIELALREDPGRVVIVAGTGGRFDHELSTSGLLCSGRWAGIEEIDWVSPRGWAHVLRRRRILHGDVGAIVSLIPIGGPATGVTTSGLKWELSGEDLESGSTRGVSNVMRSPMAEIKIDSGCLLVVFSS